MNINDLDKAAALVKQRDVHHSMANDLLNASKLSIDGHNHTLMADKYLPDRRALYLAINEVVRVHLQCEIMRIESELTKLGATFDPIVLPTNPYEYECSRSS